MTAARRLLAALRAAACLLPAVPAAMAQDDSRAGPSGPYLSKMRIVEEPAPIAPANADSALEALQEDPYGAALLLRKLGYAAAADGDMQMAVSRLRDALDRGALAPLAEAQIRADLVRLWAASDDDAALVSAYVAWQAAGHAFEASTHLAAARAGARLGRYADAAAAMDRALAAADAAPDTWRALQVFILARLGRYAEAAAIKARILDPDTAGRDDWLQIAGLYQSAGDESATLAAMETGYRAGRLTRPSDVGNLARLYRRAGLPDFAARLLADNLARGAIADNAANWLSLAEAELAARNDEAAVAPLVRAAGAGNDPLVDLQLGRLRFRLGQYKEAIASLRRATRGDLGAELGRAWLLLGEACVETGALSAARRAFGRASEIGGSYLDAQAWLDRLSREAETAAALQLEGADEQPGVAATLESAVATATSLATKTVRRQRFYYTSDAADFESLPAKSVDMARRLRNAVRRERLSASGPLQFIVLAEPGDEESGFELQVGIPVRTRTAPRGAFRNRDTKPFLCVHREFRGDPAALAAAWERLAGDVLGAGFRPTGETRTVVLNFAPPGKPLLFELQMGILANEG